MSLSTSLSGPILHLALDESPASSANTTTTTSDSPSMVTSKTSVPPTQMPTSPLTHYSHFTGRRRSLQMAFHPSSHSTTSTTPPSLTSSTTSSPGGNTHPSRSPTHDSTTISPILNPFQWTTDLCQYIMTDIGPQPSNSQVPTLRSQSHLVHRQQQRSSMCSPTMTTPSSSSASNSPYEHGHGNGSGYYSSRYSSVTDLCTIPQHEVLPAMEMPYCERRFQHDEWDDEE